MPDSTALVAGDQVGIVDEAKSIVNEAGSDPTDYHFSSQVKIATESLQNGKSREAILQETIDNLASKRDRLQVEAEIEAKELRSVILRMGKKRVKIDDLEKRVRDLKPADAGFDTDVEEASFSIKKQDLQERLKVERESMKRDEDFARKIMLKIGGELSGL